MRAVRIHGYGDTRVLRYEEVPEPVPVAGEVLVRVKACALNHLDLWVRQGMPKAPSLPHILGSDIAGEVADDTLDLKAGTPVVLFPAVTCGVCRHCLEGRETLCPEYGAIGWKVPGGNAELVKVPRVNVFPMPKNLSYVEAAAIPLVFTTAWHMLCDRAQLKVGETLLVIGAGSGVGSAAIQVGRLLGAHVIATASREEALERAKLLGAERVLNHSKAGWADGVRDVDVVFEHVGAAVWEQCLSVMAKGGRFVTCGATTGGNVPFNLTTLFLKQQSFMGSFMGTKADFAALLPFFETNQLKPVIDQVYPMRDIQAAHSRLEGRSHFGKVVVTL